ncbi:hypothetical protein ACIP5Y_11535 [Nocardia sp. NPDC088792]|uniref:hypothetical protein n=1 Tax=Nocardia sp. NPDC088792 TaxID=3364332 RepID=UPI00381D346F
MTAPPDPARRMVLVRQDGVTCWTERIPPGSYGAPHRYPSITLVLAGAPVEILDEQDRVCGGTRLLTGHVIGREDLPLPCRFANLGDRNLVLVVIEVPIGTTTFDAPPSHRMNSPDDHRRL